MFLGLQLDAANSFVLSRFCSEKYAIVFPWSLLKW